MYFQESEAIASEHPDLLGVVEQVDLQIATIFASAPLRAPDFSSAIGCDTNQVVSVFELLAGRGVLVSEAMVECRHCENLMSAAAFRQAIEDEDGFECSSCGRPFRSRAQPIIVYRITTEVLARPKPEVEGADGSAVLVALANADCVFQRWGQKWVVKFNGDIRFVDHSNGMFYIARLLTEPNRDIPANILLEAVKGIDRRVAKGTSGPLLDAQALTEYRTRYNELCEELEEAQQNNDLGRIDRIQQELEIIGAESTRATGLAGRRREKTDADKVRKQISMAVSRAITIIEKEHEAFGRHLTTFISQGQVFRYAPEPDEIVWLT